LTDWRANELRSLDGKNKPIDGLAIFLEGVLPTWEHKANKRGATVSIRRRMDLTKVELVWRHIVAVMIGESLDLSLALTGARIVDKKYGNYNIEFWICFSPKQEPKLFDYIVNGIQQTF
jgi:hypothetical protein